MSITAEQIVELFRKDVRARKMFAELLVVEPDIRLVLINAVLRDIATKRDIEKLTDYITGLSNKISGLSERLARLEGAYSELTERIGDLDKRIDALDKRIDALDKRIDNVAKISWATLLAIIGTLIATLLQTLIRS